MAWLLLNRAAKLNALDHETLVAVEHRFTTWEAGGRISVVVIGSTDTRAFCVGADLEVLARLNAATMQGWELLGHRVLDRIQRSPLLSIAAVRGHALGGGLTLATACDFRLAAESATFAQPEIDFGWIPGWGGVARLSRLIGPVRAKELCATGRRINAGMAQTLGLVHEVVPDANFEARVHEFATQLGLRSSEALRAIKFLADSQQPTTAPTEAQFDALLNAKLLQDRRAQSALAAFLSRKPRS